VSGLSQAIQGLGERSREIGEISDLITGIAEQTNLLSLNAAIEAARAGQHGRGFAIVADEVRKLAEQSAFLAKKISQLISFIQEDTTQTMQSMETATQEVKEGIQVIHNAGVSFHQIYVAVDRASEEIEEVAATIKQLSQRTEQVASAVQTVLEVAEQTASAAQNISAATEEQMVSNDDIAVSACSLATTAEQLKNLIERFKIP
jgi:methyl-accepting chemotaxis protein